MIRKRRSKSPLKPFFLFPNTPYAITDLDQAVALSAGLLVLAVSVKDAYRTGRSWVWEEFDDWRSRSTWLINHYEHGPSETEFIRLKDELRAINNTIEEVVSGPKRQALDAAIDAARANADALELEELEQKHGKAGAQLILSGFA